MSDPDDLGGLIDRVYDIAVAPERMDQLVKSWMERLPSRNEGDGYDALAEPQVFRHVQRAERVLRDLITLVGEPRDSARDWVESVRTAAVVVNRSGVVLAANDTAQRALWLTTGNALSILPVVPDDLSHLLDLIEHLEIDLDSDTRLLRLRKLGENIPLLIRIVEAVGGDPNQIGLLTTLLSWPQNLTLQLMETFRLTQAEADVLRDLTLGFGVKEIAESKGRSEATVRTQVRSLLEKTDTHSQIELVRMTLGLLDVIDQTPLIVPLRGPPGISPQPNHYNTLVLGDGRDLDYLSIGDLRGRPFIMLPTDMGFTRLSPPAEAWLAQNRMRMIVPVRAGYGHSSPLPRHRDAYEVAIADMVELMNHLHIDRCPVLAFCDDFHLAVALACAHPLRVTAIVGVGPTMPACEPKHYQRMPAWTRFVYANARYAPRALPFMTMAFFQCIRRLGPKRFLQTVMATSKADLRVLEDDELLTAMLRGTEISVGPRFTAHVAWAAGAIANYAVDWSGKLASCPVPMILYAGDQDPFAPIQTTQEFADRLTSIKLHRYPEYGQLLYPLWPEFLSTIRTHLTN